MNQKKHQQLKFQNNDKTTFFKNVAIALCITFFIASCKDNTEKKLNAYPTVTDYFTKEEIKDLAKLLDFFNGQICISSGIDKKNIIECYDNFIRSVYEMVPDGYFDFKISFEEQQEIYKQISDSLFLQIWGVVTIVGKNSPDTLKSIDLKRDGKYMKFLNELGKEYEMINNYCEDFRWAGGTSVSMAEEIINIKEKYHYDLNDTRLQLVVAIHYLRWNDGLLRNRKYYNQMIKK
jgi:hypothetical protein